MGSRAEVGRLRAEAEQSRAEAEQSRAEAEQSRAEVGRLRAAVERHQTAFAASSGNRRTTSGTVASSNFNSPNRQFNTASSSRSSRTKAALCNEAKSKGLKNYTRIDKDKLQNLLDWDRKFKENSRDLKIAELQEHLTFCTATRLQEEAKRVGIRNYSGMKVNELIESIVNHYNSR